MFQQQVLGWVVVMLMAATPVHGGIIMGNAGISSDGDPVSYRTELAIAGDILTVQLFNTSPVASSNRDDCLSSFFFDIVKSCNIRPVLSYVSAVGEVWFTDRDGVDILRTAHANLMAINSGDNTWQFKTLDAGLTPFYGFGLGTVGNSSLAPNNFSGNLVDGMDFSIYTGEVTTQSIDGLLLVKDRATFTFSGVMGFTEEDIKTTCVFGQGTGPDRLLSATTIPEPATLELLALGGWALLRRRK